MKNILGVLLVMLVTFSLLCCVNKSDDKISRLTKNKFRSTNEIDKNLFVESYFTYKGGVYGGDLISKYLTDSQNFRKYIGTYDDNSFATFVCSKTKDSVFVTEKTTTSYIVSDSITHSNIIKYNEKNT